MGVVGMMHAYVAQLRRFPWRSRLVVMLLLSLAWSVAVALSEVALGLDRALLLTIVTLALVIGWSMAARAATGWAALAVSGLTGMAVLTVRIGQLGDELVAIPLALLRFANESVRASEWGSTGALVEAAANLVTGTAVLYSRLAQWVWALATSELSVDPVASAMAWSALIWGAVVWTVWGVRRLRQPIAAVLPILTLLGISFYISAGRASAFVVPLGCTLLLMAFADHDFRQDQWEAREIDTPEGTTSSIAFGAVPIALGLTVAAAWAGSFSFRSVVRVFESLPARDERSLADSLGLARQSRPETGLEPVLVPGLPNRHLIGSGPELSEHTVMEVTLADVPIEAPAPGYRWRALTYDRYIGRGWQTSSLVLQDYDAGESLATPSSTSDRVVRQFVRGIGDLRGLGYSAGSAVALNQEVQVAWRASGLDAFALTIQQPLYQIDSIVPAVSQEQLGASGSDYPEWVREAYLDLPDDVPERVLALGRNLTATAASPYDRALALESYLRKIPYTLDVPQPPSDRDIVDYFLFDLKEGYCDYYASSMVVLARAAGLPARLVVGYFTGTPVSTEGTIRYTVTEADAHSWVEIYFPGIGWVEFDPTGGRPAIERSDEGMATLPAEPASLELEPRRLPKPRLGSLLGGLALGLAIVWLSWITVLNPLRLRSQTPTQALRALYQRLRRYTFPLGVAAHPTDTPHEFQAALGQRLGPKDLADAKRLVDAHMRAAYAREAPDSDEVSRLIRTWRWLSARLWLKRIAHQTGRIRKLRPRRRNLKSFRKH